MCQVFEDYIYVNENLCSNQMGIKLGPSYAKLTLSYAKLELSFVQLPTDFVECTKVHLVLLLTFFKTSQGVYTHNKMRY